MDNYQRVFGLSINCIRLGIDGNVISVSTKPRRNVQENIFRGKQWIRCEHRYIWSKPFQMLQTTLPIIFQIWAFNSFIFSVHQSFKYRLYSGSYQIPTDCTCNWLVSFNYSNAKRGQNCNMAFNQVNTVSFARITNSRTLCLSNGKVEALWF